MSGERQPRNGALEGLRVIDAASLISAPMVATIMADFGADVIKVEQPSGDNLRRIVITGRLDMPGTDSVASRLGELVAAPKKGVVVDLSSVQFLASIGIRALITSAKAVQQRGGKMVLVTAGGSSVLMSLEATGVDKLIPVFRNTADAERAAVA